MAQKYRDRSFWTPDRLTALAAATAAGKPAADIAAELGSSKIAIVRKCISLGIEFVRYTPEEIAEREAVVREWKDRNNDRRGKRAKAKRQAMARAVASGVSRTSPQFRNTLPRAPEMTKGELRRLLASGGIEHGKHGDC